MREFRLIIFRKYYPNKVLDTLYYFIMVQLNYGVKTDFLIIKCCELPYGWGPIIPYLKYFTDDRSTPN
ncbi:hypothetical protein HS7_21190 [Sulfolobales archaeon HS-7]|nr:hypothetical protein HS7_21190 [Sulfolobales archaeon HS-7]